MYNILYVEDDQSLLNTASIYLESKKMSVCPVWDNNIVIDTFQKVQPDLVIMDICLGNGPDGFELASKMKSYRNVPIVFASAKTDKEIIDRVEQYENSGYIAKPFRMHEFYLVIKGHLEKIENALNQSITLLGNTEFHFDENYIIINGKNIHLRPKECVVLKILVENVNHYVNKDVFHDKAWNDLKHLLKKNQLIDTISRLRGLLKPDKSLKIVNINSVGWKLECEISIELSPRTQLN